MENKQKKLLVIDCNSVLHRSFHALPPLTTKKGELVNAIYGFLLVFLKVTRELKPDFIAATFDLPLPTFRHQKFEAYKATRIPAPDELYQQLPKLKEILKAFNVPIFEKEGFEADDLIGTIATQAPKKSRTRAKPRTRAKLGSGPSRTELRSSSGLGGGLTPHRNEVSGAGQIIPEIETVIVSGDLDTLQLVDKKTKVYGLRKGVKETILYDIEKVKEKYEGLLPDQLTDFKALKGDPSDNIPGVPGIGEKTAIALIKEFGNLENLYKAIEEGEKIKFLSQSLQNRLKEYKEQAFFSKILATIKTDVPLEFSFKKCRFGKYDKEKLTKILKELEFESLIQRLP